MTLRHTGLGPISILPANTPQPDLLGPEGCLPLRPASYFDGLPYDSLRMWCHTNARYNLPTTELVDWLQAEFRGRRAIEVGAGCGDLCMHLGVPGTDNYSQEFPDVQAHYALAGQPTIKYGEWVHKLDAEDAIERFQPEVVVAAWVTQWIDPDLPLPPEGGSMYGIKESDIVDAGITYVLIGNESVHGSKKIMAAKHTTFNLPFLRSRSARPNLNRVWVWNR